MAMQLARRITLEIFRHPLMAIWLGLGVPALAWLFDVEGRLRASGWLQ